MEKRGASPDLRMRDYAAELEPHILEILHAGFGPKWGDREFWRWKHSTRPGFLPEDVIVCTTADKPIACFHLAVRNMRLAPGLDIRCSVEGDFAIQPDARGAGIPQKTYRSVSPRLVGRSVLVRSGFSSRELYERVYKPQFGHGMLPTVTARYRKILSDRALRAKLQEFGAAFRGRPWSQRFLKRRPFTVRMQIAGFQPCDLVLTPDSATCVTAADGRPDLKITLPYVLLTAARMPRLRATLTVAKAILSGQVWAAGMTRVLLRALALPLQRRSPAGE